MFAAFEFGELCVIKLGRKRDMGIFLVCIRLIPTFFILLQLEFKETLAVLPSIVLTNACYIMKEQPTHYRTTQIVLSRSIKQKTVRFFQLLDQGRLLLLQLQIVYCASLQEKINIFQRVEDRHKDFLNVLQNIQIVYVRVAMICFSSPGIQFSAYGSLL